MNGDWDIEVRKLSSGRGLGSKLLDGATMRVRLTKNGHGAPREILAINVASSVANKCGWMDKDKVCVKMSRARREILLVRTTDPSMGYAVDRVGPAASAKVEISMRALPSDIADILRGTLANRTVEVDYVPVTGGVVLSLVPKQ